MEGMITLVKLQGGIARMNTNRHIGRIIAWADVLHATAHNSLPQLGFTQSITHHEMTRLMNIVKQHNQSPRLAQENVVPTPFQKAFHALQALATAKSLLAYEAVPNLHEVRQTFSNLLFAAEHQMLELGQAGFPFNATVWSVKIVATIAAAALTFTFHGLRDIVISAPVFESLIERMHEGLCQVFDHLLDVPDPIRISDEIPSTPFLLHEQMVSQCAQDSRGRPWLFC